MGFERLFKIVQRRLQGREGGRRKWKGGGEPLVKRGARNAKLAHRKRACTDTPHTYEWIARKTRGYR